MTQSSEGTSQPCSDLQQGSAQTKNVHSLFLLPVSRGQTRTSPLLAPPLSSPGMRSKDQSVESAQSEFNDSRALSVELFMSTSSWNEDVSDDDDDHDSFEADEF